MKIPYACLSVLAVLSAAPLLTAQGTPIPKSTTEKTYPADLAKAGETTFIQHCAFCHGRDTGGGESGPDLTRSKLVADDVDGNQIGPVVRNGRGTMPRFTVTDQEL